MNRLLTQRRPQERGVALLVVLLLISVLSTVAIAVADDIRFAIRRSVNTRMNEQAQLYALGAETFARQVLWKSWKQTPGRSTLLDPWAAQGVVFAIDGGAVAGNISDAGNCFNLNSVVTPSANRTLARREAGLRQYIELLTALEIQPDQGAALAAALVDWMDTDSVAGPGGAEDAVYSGRDVPYRTGGVPLAEVSELRAIAGYSEEIYARLRPLVCALPTDDASVININTLREDQAPLLIMLSENRLRLPEARRVIAARAVTGYGSVTDFLAQDAFAGGIFGADAEGQLGVRTRYFLAESNIRYHGAHLAASALLELDNRGIVVTHARRYGSFE